MLLYSFRSHHKKSRWVFFLRQKSSLEVVSRVTIEVRQDFSGVEYSFAENVRHMSIYVVLIEA